MKLLGIKITRPPFIMVPKRGPMGGEADGIWGLVRKHPRAVWLKPGLPLCGP